MRRTDRPPAGEAADEAAATEARARIRGTGLPTLPLDVHSRPLMDPDEKLVALRHGVRFDRREPSPGRPLAPGVPGDLFVTSRRLVLAGRVTLSFALADIQDAVVSGERLLLVLRDGHGIALQVARPRLLWVEIAAARGSADTRADMAHAAGRAEQPRGPGADRR